MGETYDARTASSWWSRALHTPLSDAVRGQWTGSLDARQPAEAAGLPEPLVSVISKAVQRTRLWPSERLDLARELISHFADGLAAGRSAEELAADFGDVERAAILIRQAKLQGRPLWWHATLFVSRALLVFAAVVLVIYAAWTVRFYLGKPVLAHNYWKEINQARHVPEADRAWPIYREAALKLGRDDIDVDCLILGASCPRYEDELKKIERHRDSIELARQGAKRPRLGYYWGDPADRAAAVGQDRVDLFDARTAEDNAPLYKTNLSGIQMLRQLARFVAGDAVRSAAKGEGRTAREDIETLVALSEQLMEPSSSLVEQLVASGIFSRAMQIAGGTLYDTPDVWSDEDLLKMAHRIAAHSATSPTYSLVTGQLLFDDLLQRAYTDDGTGGGRITPEGVQLMLQIGGDNGWLSAFSTRPGAGGLAQNTQGGNAGASSVSDKTADSMRYLATPSVAAWLGSREENRVMYHSLLDEMITAHQGPAWLWPPVELDQRLLGPPHSSTTRLRYWLVSLMALHVIDPVFVLFEKDRQMQEAAIVALALELWHRRHGSWPAKLDDLVPDLLPAVPPDRVDGQPLRYVLRDGRPILYSLGRNGLDDGGMSTKQPSEAEPARYGVNETYPQTETGDWVLWPPQFDRTEATNERMSQPAESAP